jgi:hypothetical protein
MIHPGTIEQSFNVINVAMKMAMLPSVLLLLGTGPGDFAISIGSEVSGLYAAVYDLASITVWMPCCSQWVPGR